MLPFAHNESTRFISPTKTPEYLAAGKPVVSTSITDVVRPYGVQRLVRIADTPVNFAAALDAALNIDARDSDWAARRDSLLSRNSWDITWKKMRDLMERRILRQQLETLPASVAPPAPYHTGLVGD
jgi:UDP-galactopyranose mutase